MQTGLTSFLDRMVSGAGAKSAKGDPVQKGSEEAADRIGQGAGSAIAMEFARLIRALRADVSPAKAAEVSDTEPEANPLQDGEASADEDPDFMGAIPGALVLHWSREITAESANVAAGKAEAQIVETPNGEQQNTVPVEGSRRRGRTAELPTDAGTILAQTKAEGEGVAAGEIAVAKPGRERVQSDRAADVAGETESGEVVSGQDRKSPADPAPSGARRDAGELQTRLEQVRDAARNSTPRGTGAQVRVEVVAGQTHLPPIPAASASVQLLGKSIGEAVNELANASLPGEFSPEGDKGTREVSRRLVVDLHPRELGSVRVTLTRQAGELHIEIVPTTDKANDLLNSHRDALAHTIRQAGGAVAEISVRLSHDGAMGRDFQPGQNPAFSWNGGNDSGGERSGGARHYVPDSSPGAQNRQDVESAPNPERPSRNGVYL